jgi:hypothetical protein
LGVSWAGNSLRVLLYVYFPFHLPVTHISKKKFGGRGPISKRDNATNKPFLQFVKPSEVDFVHGRSTTKGHHEIRIIEKEEDRLKSRLRRVYEWVL